MSEEERGKGGESGGGNLYAAIFRESAGKRDGAQDFVGSSSREVRKKTKGASGESLERISQMSRDNGQALA